MTSGFVLVKVSFVTGTVAQFWPLAGATLI